VAVALLTERPACQSPRAERAATVCFDCARDIRGATVPCRVIRYLLYVHRVARGSAVARVKTVAVQVVCGATGIFRLMPIALTRDRGVLARASGYGYAPAIEREREREWKGDRFSLRDNGFLSRRAVEGRKVDILKACRCHREPGETTIRSLDTLSVDTRYSALPCRIVYVRARACSTVCRGVSGGHRFSDDRVGR